jgi:hypothetical protein
MAARTKTKERAILQKMKRLYADQASSSPSAILKSWEAFRKEVLKSQKTAAQNFETQKHVERLFEAMSRMQKEKTAIAENELQSLAAVTRDVDEAVAAWRQEVEVEVEQAGTRTKDSGFQSHQSSGKAESSEGNLRSHPVPIP